MATIALVKEGCGTHFVYDTQEMERHLKMGWQVRPENWKELKKKADDEKRHAALKAEQARIARELGLLEALKTAEKEAGEVKPSRTVGVDEDGDGVIDKPFKKRGRKKKE